MSARHEPARTIRRLSILLAPLGVLLPSAIAHADPEPFIRRFALRGELAIGASLPDYQARALDYRLALQGSARLAFNIIDPLSVQASFSSWYLPNGNGGGQQFSYTLGARFEPRLFGRGRGFVELNAGLGQSVSLLRFTLDAAIGYEFDVTRWFAVGPAVRYGVLFASSADFPSSAQYVTVGAAATFRWPGGEQRRAPEGPRDSDGDGILDGDDACPSTAAGATPDPEHRGCPMGDRDGDSVLDGDDACPATPAGEHPDPARRGCPTGDRDGDGVLDTADQCPDAAAGAHPDPDRAGCADGDADNDGVFDHADQCRDEAAGLHPDPARAGCPQPDRDHDGVPDATDHCPDQPGAPDTNPARNGCPGLVMIHGAQLQIRQPVFFATNRDVILPRSRPVLEAVAQALRAVPEIHRMSIEGHTDDVGDDQRNLELSQRRAQSVLRWLVEHGVEERRLEAHGFGETRPLVEGNTPAAHAQNRRVDFRIVDPAQTEAPASH